MNRRAGVCVPAFVDEAGATLRGRKDAARCGYRFRDAVKATSVASRQSRRSDQYQAIKTSTVPSSRKFIEAGIPPDRIAAQTAAATSGEMKRYIRMAVPPAFEPEITKGARKPKPPAPVHTNPTRIFGWLSFIVSGSCRVSTSYDLGHLHAQTLKASACSHCS